MSGMPPDVSLRTLALVDIVLADGLSAETSNALLPTPAEMPSMFAALTTLCATMFLMNAKLTGMEPAEAVDLFRQRVLADIVSGS